MKYSRLVTFGCSLTYGQGLKDCYVRKKNTLGDSPSNYAWPSILSAKVGVDCVNLSEPGSSNKRICHRILNTDFQKNDIVVINWSHPERFCCITENDILDIAPWKKDKISKRFYSIFVDADLLIDSNNRIRLSRLYLDKKGITNFHLISDKKNHKLDADNKLIVLAPSIQEIRKSYPRALDLIHPNEEAHAHFAQEIYNEIKDRL
jgi:lysophospholipase L1-like esterase